MRLTTQLYCVLSAMLAMSFSVADSPAKDQSTGLDIYYLRHAETIANVTGVYTFKNESRFSPAGAEQAAGVVDLLKDHDFDAIICSPSYRTRNTILPYLKATGQVAEIWPEAEECCWHKDRETPARPEIDFRNRILLKEDEAPYFSFRDEQADCWIKLRTYNDGIQIVQRTRELLMEKFNGQKKSLLIVGHQLSGSRLIEILLGLEPVGRFKLPNASLSHIRQNTMGDFEIVEIGGDE